MAKNNEMVKNDISISDKSVAILVDGDFFIRKFNRIANPGHNVPVIELAKDMWLYWIKHVDKSAGEKLHRIFFYDCPPLKKKIHHPVTERFIDFSKTDIAQFRTSLHAALINQPFVAKRMGYLDENNGRWLIKSKDIHRKVLKGTINLDDLAESDIIYRAGQKGVDMKLGLDIATLTLKKQVQKIVLISGDSDFVPAAKLARTEGVHFVLDAMNANLRPDLREHIDQLTTFSKKIKKKGSNLY